MPKLRWGIYEDLVTKAVQECLDGASPRAVEVEPLRTEMAADRVALHLSRVIERAIGALPDGVRVQVANELITGVLREVGGTIPSVDVEPDRPVNGLKVLQGIKGHSPGGELESIPRPLVPLLDTTLLTNSRGEPRYFNALVSEIASSSAIDVIVAFIRRSGVRDFLEPLRSFCERGGRVRVLTTTYTGSTERRALDELAATGAEVRVSYDQSSTRLHAKAWIFHRDYGTSTAYVGSSNMTRSAQMHGMEWNIRLSEARNRSTLARLASVFQSYWASDDFRAYEPEQFDAAMTTLQSRRSGYDASLIGALELRPYSFQERLLEQISASRQMGHHRNLLVAATGTGKTVMAAVDYRRLRSVLPRARLLFVAHRSEILAQARTTYRIAMRDHAFGELWVDGIRPSKYDHVFASIQSLSTADLGHLAKEHFDVVVVDEFHHAAAATYRALLSNLKPRELLGLTATPERADGQSVTELFDGRIAAELRLWDAIEKQRLVPFRYYGLHDGMDLSEVPWRRGRGYDVQGLTRVYTAHDHWAKFVLSKIIDFVGDVDELKAFGFCVSVDHAKFMARVFAESGIPAVAVYGGTPRGERERALRDLRDGGLRVIFSVDLFNEGVDVPSVNTLLLLRPTDSPTLFLQQLGRGLRQADDKPYCLVLDFVGNHRKEFRFERRFRAVLGGTRRELREQVEKGFPYLPSGCHLQLDPVVSEAVLRSIRTSVGTNWRRKVEELQLVARTSPDVSLSSYLRETELEVEDIYHGGRSWSDLLEAAGLSIARIGPHEPSLRRSLSRLLHVDDRGRLSFIRRWIQQGFRLRGLGEQERRLARMLTSQLFTRVSSAALGKDASLSDGTRLLNQHPSVIAELRQLVEVLLERIDHVHQPLETHPDVPLSIHARYTRLEILSAFGVGQGAKTHAWQTGVLRREEERADLMAFTVDKSSGGFSPTTRYRDYAISPQLLHWESQGVVREGSATGRRYIEHEQRGDRILFFGRVRSDERAFWFLGPGTYVSHRGERPMAITWKLAHRLPADIYAALGAPAG